MYVNAYIGPRYAPGRKMSK